VNPAQHILIFAVRVYRWTISPVLVLVFGATAGCRFTPTCSGYALEALRTHGVSRGAWLTTRRLCRCHPWGGCGHDPVPAGKPPEERLYLKTTPPGLAPGIR